MHAPRARAPCTRLEPNEKAHRIFESNIEPQQYTLVNSLWRGSEVHRFNDYLTVIA